MTGRNRGRQFTLLAHHGCHRGHDVDWVWQQPFPEQAKPTFVCPRCVAEARAKLQLEQWRAEVHFQGGDRAHLSDRLCADWFVNWPTFKTRR